MVNVIELLKAAKIASNDFQASHIANGLKLYELGTDEAMIERAALYRKWRPRTDKKNDLPTWQAYQLAIAGIDPADVVVRQMEIPVGINFADMRLRCNDDPVIAVFMVRDLQVVKDAGLDDLAWALDKNGCSKNDALGFFELLERYVNEKKSAPTLREMAQDLQQPKFIEKMEPS